MICALGILVAQLNIYFAWTSRVGTARGYRHVSGLRSFLVSEVNSVTRAQLSIPFVGNYFAGLASSGRAYNLRYMLEMKYFIDCEVIVFTLAIFVISAVLFLRRNGFALSILRAVEITFLVILPLGIEIYFFDRGQFNIHASDIQAKIGLAWFTNADVLYCSLAVLIVAVSIEITRRLENDRRQGAPNEPTPRGTMSLGSHRTLCRTLH